MSEKASKGRFLEPEKLQNHSNKEKGKDKKKERGEEKKSNGCALSFCNSYFGNSFWPKKTATSFPPHPFFERKALGTRLKKLLDAKTGPFGDNVFKNPGRYK